MTLPPHLNQAIAQLFAEMDEAYETAASSSGFVCQGCEENCCLTRFHHHTLMEYLYLRRGLEQLPVETRNRLHSGALDAVARMKAQEDSGETARVMCPLNTDGRCLLYTWRPMICRLHGIPHQLRRPDGRCQTGPGCDDFHARCKAPHGSELDRTPLYVKMAELERQVRQETGFNRKIKMTIAEMILDEIF